MVASALLRNAKRVRIWSALLSYRRTAQARLWQRWRRVKDGHYNFGHSDGNAGQESGILADVSLSALTIRPTDLSIRAS